MGTGDADQVDAPISIVVAMDAELRHLLAAGVEREETAGIWLDHYQTIGGLPVVAMRSGMGMVNAAAATERMIATHHPRIVMNFGCSGAHRRDIMPGDVIIGERSVHHSAVHILANGDELFVGGKYDVGGETMNAADLPSDPELVRMAHDAAAGWVPEDWPVAAGWPEGVPYRQPKIHMGNVASADVWTQAHARLDVLHQRHATLCEDMEAAAIAQICARHQVPFLTIKDISNNEFHAATDIEEGFTAFPTEEVGKRAAALLRRVIERLARANAESLPPSILSTTP